MLLHQLMRGQPMHILYHASTQDSKGCNEERATLFALPMLTYDNVSGVIDTYRQAFSKEGGISMKLSPYAFI